MTRWVLVGLAVVSLQARADEDDDELMAPFKRARTVGACVAQWKRLEAMGLPTAYVRGASGEAAQCTRRVMNAEVDRLIVPLKKSQPALFRRGMDVQRLFNEAVKTYCGRWDAWYEKCCVTCSYTEQPACEEAFHGTRVKQAQAALARTGPVEQKAATRAKTADFEAYAREWCGFLGDAHVAVDDACVGRVLGQLEAEQPDDGRALSCR